MDNLIPAIVLIFIFLKPLTKLILFLKPVFNLVGIIIALIFMLMARLFFHLSDNKENYQKSIKNTYNKIRKK